MLLSLFLLVFSTPLFASASTHHHDHSKHSHLHGSHKRSDHGSLEEARELLARGQAAMARANHAIVSNPRPNRLEVLNSTELSRARKPPPLLDYSGNATASSLKFRRGDGASGNGTEGDMRYTVPDELIEAARLLSENWSPSDEDMGYDAAAAVVDLQTRFKIKVNDTNMMPPMLQYGSGLMAPVEEPPSAFRYSDNSSDLVEPTGEDQSGQGPQKRAASDWWMSSMDQRGFSPFAPSGYEVWRNVKDFGAKGDGKADDTDAINKAISSGGRCGGGTCTGSTIYPATVYFPPGTYKVSSSIIQYYNTEIIGNPLDLPTIIAAPSFVGLGVISSNVYTGETSQWYLNQNNFLRSVRNMIVDIRPTPAAAQVCGIHWQVAQGTSLENVHFYMVKPKDDPSTTQQGIYMENGSGGFLSDLYFVGGKFGAYMGNQQFTASGLFFQDAGTAIQIHWDWGWTMQDIVVDNCDVGFTIVGGAGGPMSTGQGIGSLLLTDLRMHYVKLAISTSVMSDNSTALLLSNSGFYNVDTIVKDTTQNKVLIAGGTGTKDVASWGFGRVTYADGTTKFLNGAALDAPVRDSSLVTGGRKQFFTRRRPKYDDLGRSEIIDAKAKGARGDGKTDDTAVLNYIFSAAANMSAVVYLPFGVYLIKDTVEIPVGSRIIGQAWPQIMATGPKFENALKPRVAVRVGRPGQAGVIEVQSVMFTVKGATAGAVMMEWNVHETIQGSAGLWDAHFRVGGAAGTDLTVKDCPKLTGKVNEKCIAASLMLHLTAQSSAYLENVWMWTADHDFDTPDQAQMDVYVGRGMLVESKGPTWLWGTSVEHCVLYQYQLTGAENIVMGLIQTESPYFQSVPTAPAPFKPGAFPDDPAFQDCSSKSKTCGVSWAIRIIDSSAIHVLSAGLYSFFSRYDQACINSGRHDCQDKIFYTEQSFDVWVYNLVTLGSIEMISPLNGDPTLGKPNRNGFASSILAWLGGAKQVTGKRNFVGYKVHADDTIGLSVFPEACRNALTALVRCDNNTREWKRAEYHGIMPKEVDVASVCDAGCAQSISDWLKAVDTYCTGLTWEDGTSPGILGSFISYGINETCQTDKKSGKYCNGEPPAFV
ncbi:putative glucan 1,3-beta-glucosidase [Ilyonectria robusta]